jgi:hypothetical protein
LSDSEITVKDVYDGMSGAQKAAVSSLIVDAIYDRPGSKSLYRKIFRTPVFRIYDEMTETQKQVTKYMIQEQLRKTPVEKSLTVLEVLNAR